jgi:hypothetical protein
MGKGRYNSKGSISGVFANDGNCGREGKGRAGQGDVQLNVADSVQASKALQVRKNRQHRPKRS